MGDGEEGPCQGVPPGTAFPLFYKFSRETCQRSHTILSF